MLVRDIMTSPVITVSPEASIQEVARLMRDNAISGVPVLDDSKLVGIVTEVDLIARHAPAKEPQYISMLWATIPLRFDDYERYREQVRHILAVNAAQLMTADPTTITPEERLEDAADLMTRPGHRSIPVVENGNLVGIVTRTDFVQMIEELELADAGK